MRSAQARDRHNGIDGDTNKTRSNLQNVLDTSVKIERLNEWVFVSVCELV